jgi:protein archease
VDDRDRPDATLLRGGHGCPVTYSFAEHTGEVEVEIHAATEAAVFEAALQMFTELAAGGEAGAPAEHEIALSAGGHELLLVDWLNELVFLAEVELFVPTKLASFELSDDGLRAVVSGVQGRPRQLVKAVTLNRLALDEREGEWHARVVLDV